MAKQAQASLKKVMDAIELNLDEAGQLVDITDLGTLADAAQYVGNGKPNSDKAKERAVRLAKKCIGLVERKQTEPDYRPSDLPNVLDYCIQTTLSANELDNALEKARELSAYARKHSYMGELEGSEKIQAWRPQHVAVLIEAIVRKYFSEKLKAATSKRKAARLMDLTADEQAVAKDWLKQHTTNLYFSVPTNDDNSYLGDSSIPEEDAEKRDESDRFVQDMWDSEYRALLNMYPLLKNSDHIVERLTSQSTDLRKDMWHISGHTRFNVNIDQAPDVIKKMIDIARSQATKETKTMDASKDDKEVNSMAFAKAVLNLFDKNPDFYRENFSDELIDEYN